MVGTDEEWETEGRDRRTMGLPGTQDALVRAVAAANPRTVVVVNAGAAVDLPWADDVAAVLVAWFPGMAAGEALARVLVGDDEPGGRLPITVPVSVEDAPCTISHAEPPGELHYTEGILVGHRWYLTKAVEPRWWFGQGQGYTTFAWGLPAAPASWVPGGPLTVTLPITNSGTRAGAEVVQAYLRRPSSTVARPAWVLGGFAKARIDVGAHGAGGGGDRPGRAPALGRRPGQLGGRAGAAGRPGGPLGGRPRSDRGGRHRGWVSGVSPSARCRARPSSPSLAR